MFPGPLCGSDGCSQLVEDCETGLPANTRWRTEEGIRSYRAIALSSVVSKRCASCVVMRMEKEKGPETWKRPHLGGVNNISCQHLQVLVINLSQKHLEWQDEVSPMSKHGSVIRPTMFMASLDIKSAFDEARPRHIARILESHNIHGWLIAALLREMSGLEGESMFECVESSFTFKPCLRLGSVEALRLWQMMAAQILASVESGHRKTFPSCFTSKKRRRIRYAASCGPTTSGLCPTPREIGTDATRPD